MVTATLHNPAYVGAYISWDEFMANQAQLQANQTSYKRGHRGAARRGEALLRSLEQMQREYESWCRRQHIALTEEDREQILALARTCRACAAVA